MIKLLKKIKYWFSKEYCYSKMEDSGYAAMGCCGGIAGNDSSTENLAYCCIGCPYFTFVDGSK